MSSTIRLAPALLSLALRPLPLAPLNLLLTGLLGAVMREHPEIHERLGVHAFKCFGLKPLDLPFSLVLEPRPEAPRLVAVRNLIAYRLDARITGSLAVFLGLAQATVDGDSLFFSRDLMIEGDVSAVVALRNALDDAGVDLISVTAAGLRPLGPGLERMAAQAGARLAPLLGARPWN
jgi:predicted lipid carrier protein YhbT